MGFDSGHTQKCLEIALHIPSCLRWQNTWLWWDGKHNTWFSRGTIVQNNMNMFNYGAYVIAPKTLINCGTAREQLHKRCHSHVDNGCSKQVKHWLNVSSKPDCENQDFKNVMCMEMQKRKTVVRLMVRFPITMYLRVRETGNPVSIGSNTSRASVLNCGPVTQVTHNQWRCNRKSQTTTDWLVIKQINTRCPSIAWVLHQENLRHSREWSSPSQRHDQEEIWSFARVNNTLLSRWSFKQIANCSQASLSKTQEQTCQQCLAVYPMSTNPVSKCVTKTKQLR